MSKAATSGKPGQLRGEHARQAILAAAAELFTRNGYRRTSIEDIARRAGISRPTVYAHFESKENVFQTIVRDLHEEAMAAMEKELGRDAPVGDRLYDALVARFGRFVELTSSSPSARELLEEGSRMCSDITSDARTRTLKLLRDLLTDADARGELDLGRSGLSPTAAAAVIYHSAEGAKEDGTIRAPAYRRRLRQVVAALLGGLAAR